MQLYKLDFPNGKSYIGITSKTAQERFIGHCNPAQKQNLCQKAIHKYGKENVIINVLAECDNWELLCIAEQEAIEKFNTITPNGYNLTLGGEGTYGLKWSEESKSKLSEIGKKNMTEDKKMCLLMINKGRKATEDTKNKISEAGKKRASPSEETRKKLSISASNITDETRLKRSLSLKTSS